MTKTEHYSLPQWEAHDALKRSDFNEANAAVDGALGQLWNGLLQMGERYLKERYAAMDETALTQEPNLLLNPLSSAGMAETLTGAEWDAEQKVHIGRGPEVSRTYLRSYCTESTYAIVTTTYKDVTSTYSFTSPVDGRVLDFDMPYYLFFSSTNTAFTGGSLTFTAYEKQNGNYVSIYTQSGITLEESGTSAIKRIITVAVDVSLKEGYEYRFTLHVDSGSGVLGRIGFGVEDGTDESKFTVLIDPITVGAHTKQLTTRDSTSHALVLVEYQQEKGTDGIAVSVDGAQLTEVERVTAQGDSAATHTVTCIGAIPTGTEHTLTFDLTCSGTDKLCLNKYGVYLL